MIEPGTASNTTRASRSYARLTLPLGVVAAALLLLAGMAGSASAQTPGTAAPTSSGGAARTLSGNATQRTVRQGSRSSRASARMKAVPAPARVILVFPTDGKGGVSDQISDVITETIQGRIAASGRYQTVYFLRSIPTVARALNEATLTANEVSRPYDDDAKLRKLMPHTGFDMALTTSVDSYTYDPAKNQVTLLVSARLIDYRGEKPVVRAAAENASSPANGGNAKEITLASNLAKSIAEKLMTSLLSQERGTAAPAGGAGK